MSEARILYLLPLIIIIPITALPGLSAYMQLAYIEVLVPVMIGLMACGGGLIISALLEEWLPHTRIFSFALLLLVMGLISQGLAYTLPMLNTAQVVMGLALGVLLAMPQVSARGRKHYGIVFAVLILLSTAVGILMTWLWAWRGHYWTLGLASLLLGSLVLVHTPASQLHHAISSAAIKSRLLALTTVLKHFRFWLNTLSASVAIALTLLLIAIIPHWTHQPLLQTASLAGLVLGSVFGTQANTGNFYIVSGGFGLALIGLLLALFGFYLYPALTVTFCGLGMIWARTQYAASQPFKRHASLAWRIALGLQLLLSASVMAVFSLFPEIEFKIFLQALTGLIASTWLLYGAMIYGAVKYRH